MAKETFHDSYLTGAVCLLVIVRLLQVTVDWVVELHYGTVLGSDFDPVPRKILQQPMKEVIRPIEGNPSKSWILDFRHWTLDSLSEELEFPILIVSKIPDSKSCNPDFKAQDSPFHKHDGFSGFRIFLNSGIQFPYTGCAKRLRPQTVPKCNSAQHGRSLTRAS